MMKKNKSRKLPPHSNQAHPLAHKGEANKTYVIAVIAIIVVVALALLLLIGRPSVGKAFFTGNINTFGIATPGTVYAGESFIILIRANIGSAETVALGFNMSFPSTLNCTAVTSNLGWTDGAVVLNTSRCDPINHIVEFQYATLNTTSAKTGAFDIASITFAGAPTGSYPLTFSYVEIINFIGHTPILLSGALEGATINIAPLAPTPRECGGIPPTTSPGVPSGVIQGYGSYVNGTTPTTWTYNDSTEWSTGNLNVPGPSQCKWKCVSGYVGNGTTCVAVTPSCATSPALCSNQANCVAADHYWNIVGELSGCYSECTFEAQPIAVGSHVCVSPAPPLTCTPEITVCPAPRNCGTVDNGCGVLLTCGGGTCPTGQTCTQGQCTAIIAPAEEPITPITITVTQDGTTVSNLSNNNIYHVQVRIAPTTSLPANHLVIVTVNYGTEQRTQFVNFKPAVAYPNIETIEFDHQVSGSGNLTIKVFVWSNWPSSGGIWSDLMTMKESNPYAIS